jgi:dCMP deaminase
MISTGWNGTPAGMDNCCEKGEVIRVYNEDGIYQGERRKTSPETIHAERNAIDKMTRQGVPTEGAVLFITRAPCFECAKALHGLGLRAIYYREQHDDMRGVEMLRKLGILVEQHFTTTVVQRLNAYYQRGSV